MPEQGIAETTIPPGPPASPERSPGLVEPQKLRVPFVFQTPLLACGAQLKSTFALAKRNTIFIGRLGGDLENLETFECFERGIEIVKKQARIEPEIIAHDLHPEYLSTKYAKARKALNPALQTAAIQHHHAHIVSCLVDNQVDNHPVIGVAFDGTGLGEDGNLWGGEFLIADHADFKRVAHLRYIPLPGGERAVREPWRMAAAYLYQACGEGFRQLDLAFVDRLDKGKWGILQKMIEQKINCPLTSSMGRLFDAVSSLVGVRDIITYGGQAAVELEMAMGEIADSQDPLPSYRYTSGEEGAGLVINPEDIIIGIAKDLSGAVPVEEVSWKFHNTIARIIVDTCQKIAERSGLKEVALSGGVFQNRFLSRMARRGLLERGFKVYLHHRLPAHDGGISVGQAVIADTGRKKIICV